MPTRLHAARLVVLLAITPLVLTACSGAGNAASSGATTTPSSSLSATSDSPMTISPAVERPSTRGAAETFTGQVDVTPLTEASADITASAAEVAFSPGARSAWHTHPAGQSLIVTDGVGWVQVRGEERRDITAGDVVWTPAGVEHWHGATAEAGMTHLALTGVLDGDNAEWGDLVSDEEYLGR